MNYLSRANQGDIMQSQKSNNFTTFVSGMKSDTELEYKKLSDYQKQPAHIRHIPDLTLSVSTWFEKHKKGQWEAHLSMITMYVADNLPKYYSTSLHKRKHYEIKESYQKFSFSLIDMFGDMTLESLIEHVKDKYNLLGGDDLGSFLINSIEKKDSEFSYPNTSITFAAQTWDIVLAYQEEEV